MPAVYENSKHAFKLNADDAMAGITLEGHSLAYNHQTINAFAEVLPVFNSFTRKEYFVDLFLRKAGKADWRAIPSDPWVKVSVDRGRLNSKKSNSEQRVWVSIDWDRVPKGTSAVEAPLGHDFQLVPSGFKVNSSIRFEIGSESFDVGVSVFNPASVDLSKFEGFVEDRGFVSIPAEGISEETEWNRIEGIWIYRICSR